MGLKYKEGQQIFFLFTNDRVIIITLFQIFNYKLLETILSSFHFLKMYSRNL